MAAPEPLKHDAAKDLRKAALNYPTSLEDFPWGDRAFKVGKKVFMFLVGNEAGGFTLTLKLPFRAADALRMKGAAPTGYGLGKAGWVSFRFGPKSRVPLAMLLDYLDESWRAVAPKKLSSTHPPPGAKRTS